MEHSPMRFPRSDFVCTLCDDRIYVAGGQSSLACAPARRHLSGPRGAQRSGCFRHSDRQVGAHGEDVAARCSAEPDRGRGREAMTWKGHIEAYDAELNMWNEVDSSGLRTMPYPISPSDERHRPEVQELCLTMAPIRTRLYFLGGYKMARECSSSRTLSVVRAFDTLASGNHEAWRSFEPTDEEGEKELCSPTLLCCSSTVLINPICYLNKILRLTSTFYYSRRGNRNKGNVRARRTNLIPMKPGLLRILIDININVRQAHAAH